MCNTKDIQKHELKNCVTCVFMHYVYDIFTLHVYL